VSKIQVVNTKMHSNFGHKNHYVSSIPNSFTQLVMQTDFKHSGTKKIFQIIILNTRNVFFNLIGVRMRCVTVCWFNWCKYLFFNAYSTFYKYNNI